MLLIADTGSEEEFIGLTGSCAITEGQPPQIVDLDSITAAVFKLTEKCTGVLVIGVDESIAEIADQQRITEATKVRRSMRQAPGGIEVAARDKAAELVVVVFSFMPTLSR